MAFRENQEIDSEFILLVEEYGKSIQPPQIYKTKEFKIPEGSNLIELHLDGDTSTCSLYKNEKAKVTFANIFKVADSVQFQAKEKAGVLPEHLSEQFSYRKQVCKPCLDNGKCLVCGCKTPGRMYSRAKCAGGKYPALMDKEEWEQYKAERSLQISAFNTALGEDAQRSERS